MTGEQVKSAICIHAALVDVFEHIGSRKSKPLGSKGAGILRSSTEEDGFALLLYAPITKKHDFYVDIPLGFTFALLPDNWATFKDVNTGRLYSFQFKSQEDCSNFARQVILIKDYRQVIISKNLGSVRRMLIQDLVLGPQDGKLVQQGDHIKIKYDVYLPGPQHPQGMSALVVHREVKRFELGDKSIPTALAQGVIGMRKKGTRFLVLPPGFLASADFSQWSTTLTEQNTIFIQITITSIRKRDELKVKQKKLEKNLIDLAERVTPTGDKVEGGAPDISGLFDSTSTSSSQDLTAMGSGIGFLPGSFGETTPPTFAPSPYPSAPSPPQYVPPPQTATTTTTTVTPTPMPLPTFPTLPDALPVTSSTTTGSTSSGTQSSALAGLPVKDVSELLKELGLQEYESAFQKEGVHLADLLMLESDELKELVPQMGPRKRLVARLKQLREIRDKAAAGETPSSTPSTSTPTPTTPQKLDPVAMLAQALHHQQLKSRGQTEESQPGTTPKTAPQKEISLDDETLFGDFDVSSFASPPQTSAPSATEALEKEYKRGQQEALQKAKEQIEKIKAAAKAKFAEMESEIAAVRESKDDQQNKTKKIIENLKEEIRSSKTENEQLKKTLTKSKLDHETAVEKTRQFVVQVRESKKNNKENLKKVVKDLMGKVHTKIKGSVKPNELYDGTHITTLTRATLKQITETFLEELAAEEET